MKNSFGRILDKILEYEWVVLLLIAYPMLFPRPGTTPVMLVIPILWILHWIREGQPLPATPLNLPILLLSIMLLVSLWATFSIEFSLPKISGLIFALGVFFATVRYSLKSIHNVLLFYLSCGLAVSGLGLLATNWPSKIPILSDLISRLPRVITSLPAAEAGIHPNELGGILFLFALPSIWLAWRSTRKGFSQQKILGIVLWVLAIGFSGLLFLTQSRSALLGFAGAMAFFLFVSGRWGRVTLLISAAALFVFILVVGPEEILYFPGLDTSGFATFGQVSISDRLEIWSRAIYALQDFAFTGMGLGTFRVIGPLFYPFFFIEPSRDIAHAHNLFFQSGLDFGILGIISISSIWGTIFPLTYRSAKMEKKLLILRGLSVQDFAIGLGGGLLGHLVFSLVDAVALGARPGFLIWMSLGLCTALYIFVQRESHFQNCRAIRC
jgi:putative inorganic carbon (HCO3(-)) transporter